VRLLPKALFRRFPYRTLALLAGALELTTRLLAPLVALAAGMSRRLGLGRAFDPLRLSIAREQFGSLVAADVALNPELAAPYPFCRLSGPANVLVMPAFHSAAISTKMLQELGGATVIGPLLVGLDNSVQIVNLSSKDTDLVNMAALAAYNVSG
jgi:hypothetical protein